MAYSTSPGIITDGLVFYYDMQNTSKSYKGAPTTNVVANAAAFSGWTNYWRTDYINTFVTEFGTTGYRITGNPSWNGVYRGITLPSTGTYTFSAWFRYWGGTTSNNGSTIYISGYGLSDTAVALNKNLIGVWQRVTLTVTATATSGTFYLISYGGDSTGRADCSTWDVTMPQVEAGSTATAFVDGARTTTTALLDLTNNYQLTMNAGITYNSNNTFLFPESTTGNIDLNTQSLISGMNPFTIESWTNKISGSYGAILGNFGSGYSTGLWWATAGLYIQGSVYHTDYANTMAGIHHSAVTRDFSGNVRLYRDGVLVNTGVLSSSVPSNINWRIGGDVNGGSEALNGYIYNLKTYNYVLSDAQIYQNFSALRGIYGI